MSKMRIYILAAVAAAGIGLGGTFGASAVPMNGNLRADFSRLDRIPRKIWIGECGGGDSNSGE